MSRGSSPLSLALFSVLTLSSTALAQETERIAVLQFSGPLPNDVLMMLTDEARDGALSAIRNLNYTVMTRENTQAILVEQGLDPDACIAESSCEVEFGQNIGAALVVSGMVVEVDGNLNLTMKLFETQRGSFLGSVRVRALSAQDLLEEVSAGAFELHVDGLKILPVSSEERGSMPGPMSIWHTPAAEMLAELPGCKSSGPAFLGVCSRGDFVGALHMGFVLWANVRNDHYGIAQIAYVTQTQGRFYGLIQFGLYARAGSFRGLMQLGLVNEVEEGLVGSQIGLVNRAGEVRGVQIGLFNHAGILRGVQIGMANRSDQNGLPFMVGINAGF